MTHKERALNLLEVLFMKAYGHFGPDQRKESKALVHHLTEHIKQEVLAELDRRDDEQAEADIAAYDAASALDY